MGFLSDYRGNLRFWLKGYLFVGVALLILLVFLYTNRVIKRMEEQSAATTRLFSRSSPSGSASRAVGEKGHAP